MISEATHRSPFPQYSYPFVQNFDRETSWICYSGIPSHYAPTLEKVRKRVSKFVRGLWQVPYEAALQLVRLFSLTHWRIRGDLKTMFKIIHSLLEFPTKPIFTSPTRSGLKVPPTEMLYPPSPTYMHQLCYSIVEKNCRLRLSMR